MVLRETRSTSIILQTESWSQVETWPENKSHWPCWATAGDAACLWETNCHAPCWSAVWHHKLGNTPSNCFHFSLKSGAVPVHENDDSEQRNLKERQWNTAPSLTHQESVTKFLSPCHNRTEVSGLRLYAYAKNSNTAPKTDFRFGPQHEGFALLVL